MTFSLCLSFTGNYFSFIIFFLCVSPCVVICKPTASLSVALTSVSHIATMGEKSTCATINISRCNNACAADNVCEQNCNISQNVKITDYWSKTQVLKGYSYVNITELKISDKCQVTLCEDQDLMGYCAQVSFVMQDAQTFGVN